RKGARADLGLNVHFLGENYFITADRMQILALLLSTYETAYQNNLELVKAKEELRVLNEKLEEKVEARTAALMAEMLARKQTEKELNQTSQQLSVMLESLPVACFISEADGNYGAIYVTENIKNITSFLPEDFTSKSSFWADRIHPEDAPVIFEGLKKLSEKRYHEHQYRWQVADGSYKWFYESLRLIESPEGKHHCVGMMQDITERKKAENEMAALEEQFWQAQKMEAIARLTGGIAHDFNNLLTVIIGYCQLCLMELRDSDPLRENIEEMGKAANRAANLTRQLLAFSRRQVMEMSILNLNELLADLDKMLCRVIGEDVELAIMPASDLGTVKADPGQIEQVILNLVVNARDAMPCGGKLTIGTANVELDEIYARNHSGAKPGSYVMLSVSDTGAGMDQETKEKIFEPFFTTKEKGKGTGLGLATVHGIVKQSGGDIWVYSEPTKGTTFKIYLPRVDEEPAYADEKESGEFARGNETVLLVEDEEGVRKLVMLILQTQGYNVLEAAHAGDALFACEQHTGPIHLVLTDVVMPEMSGPELAKRLSQIRPDMKVIYMSGYTDDAIVHHGVLQKEMDYIQKPYTVEKLTRKIRQVLDR
ncbi:MAG: response regulator, partial [Candidatus Lindowbacteria bacterium]|nr:response regulator [Candidatus Lindowbacteria bacterium]